MSHVGVHTARGRRKAYLTHPGTSSARRYRGWEVFLGVVWPFEPSRGRYLMHCPRGRDSTLPGSGNIKEPVHPQDEMTHGLKLSFSFWFRAAECAGFLLVVYGTCVSWFFLWFFGIFFRVVFGLGMVRGDQSSPDVPLMGNQTPSCWGVLRFLSVCVCVRKEECTLAQVLIVCEEKMFYLEWVVKCTCFQYRSEYNI